MVGTRSESPLCGNEKLTPSVEHLAPSVQLDGAIVGCLDLALPRVRKSGVDVEAPFRTHLFV